MFILFLFSVLRLEDAFISCVSPLRGLEMNNFKNSHIIACLRILKSSKTHRVVGDLWYDHRGDGLHFLLLKRQGSCVSQILAPGRYLIRHLTWPSSREHGCVPVYILNYTVWPLPILVKLDLHIIAVRFASSKPSPFHVSHSFLFLLVFCRRENIQNFHFF